jgi:hypothetical protein
VTVEYVAAGGTYICNSGYFCAGAWDGIRWKVFHLYTCRLYTLSNWTGSGFYLNNQTGGVVARFYNNTGAQIGTAAADGVQRTRNWDPVAYIRNC